MTDKALLKNIFAAQVLCLGRLIQAEKATKGVITTSKCVSEALAEIVDLRDNILKALTQRR